MYNSRPSPLLKPPDRSPMTNPQPPEQPTGQPGGPSAATILIMALILVIGGYFLTQKLAAMSRIQDCVMSGRTNCAPIQTP